MRFQEHKDMMSAILRWTEWQIKTATQARNKTERGSCQNAMLSGKVKAYVDVAQMIRNKYPNHLTDDVL